ncbi:hypothetical protein [Paenibacillus odorifer]|uniref:hypothetical protein n=1 Tax=Paenibacillus odorifer TaxID=189426 RepID=UPI00096CE2C8|nr:hypothetical protein [Paenibacillus odorifer]OME10728.1 hypothetical protein BSK60_23780 [Paenibacillus odorifer]
MSDTAVYIFRGNYFTEYSDMSLFKEKALKDLNLNLTAEISLPEIFSQHLGEYGDNLNKLFFENIMYSHLKHIQINKILLPTSMPKQQYKSRMKRIIEELNHKATIPQALHTQMDENGFYMLDRLSITSIGTKFVAALDYIEDDEKIKCIRMLFVEVVPREGGGTAYLLAGTEIDFENRVFMIMSRHTSGVLRSTIEDDEDENHHSNSVAKIAKKVMNLIIQPLGISTTINSESDREGLFGFCQNLDESLLRDYRLFVGRKLNRVLKTTTSDLYDALFGDDDELALALSSMRNKFAKRVNANLLGNYINAKVTNIEIIRKAKGLKLPGFPTRISFTSEKLSRGSTESAGARNPIVTSELYHSLYSSFSDAKKLRTFSVSWFTDFNHLNEKNIDLVQTTMYSNLKSFRIVFKAHRALGKELIDHVLGYIHSCRNY